MAGMQKDCRNNPCQRFGSALNLNIHLHMLVLDGAYTFTDDRARFHRAPADKEILAFCNNGYRSAHANLVLRMLGFSRVRNYVESWQEWGNRGSRPIVVPES